MIVVTLTTDASANAAALRAAIAAAKRAGQSIYLPPGCWPVSAKEGQV